MNLEEYKVCNYLTSVYTGPTSFQLGRMNSLDSSTKEFSLQQIPIYNNLVQYDNTLTKLVDLIDNFKPDIATAKELIQVDAELTTHLNGLQDYDRINIKRKNLDMKLNALNEKSVTFLRKLNQMHDDLAALPTVEQIEYEYELIKRQKEKTNYKTLLDYATKLSKFTKIPPTFNKSAIGPNNFIWPAEDALRKGMLALASLHKDELTRLLGDEVAEETKNERTNSDVSQQDDNEDKNTDKDDSIIFGKKSDNKESNPSQEQPEGDAMDLDLDLFDPDEF